MSTTPLSRQPSSGNLESSSEEKSNERDIVPGSNTKPETQQKAPPREGTWRSGSAPSHQEAEKASEPMLSQRRRDAAAIAAPSATAKAATARTPNTSSSQTPATMPGATVKPAPVSTSAVSGQVESNSKVYDKTKVSGDQIPDAIASALRAGFQGFASVPDPTNPSKMKNVPVFNIPPKHIARLFVGLECNFGEEKLNGQKMVKPLRDKFGIKNFRINDVTVINEINFIDHILKPFIQKEFNKEEFEQVRREVKDGFNRFASKGNETILETVEEKM